MRSIVARCLKFVGVFLVLIFIFNILLYLSCLIDSKLLTKTMWETCLIFEEQGYHYELCHNLAIRNDNGCDAMIINELYAVDCNHPYISYMKARKNYDPELTAFEASDYIGEGMSSLYVDEIKGERYGYIGFDPIKEIRHYLENRLHISVNYGRYWHGNFLIYRPLMVFFNMSQIRLLLFIVFVCLYIYFIYLLFRRFGKSITIIYGLSLLFSGYFSVSFCLSNAPIFLVMIVSGIILLKRIDVVKDISLFVFVVACVSNYFEFLTVPLITLAMVCSLYLLKLMEEGKDWIYCLKFIVVHSLIWLLGFAGTWMCKWVQYDLTINDGNSLVEIGLKQCFFRMQRISHEITTDEYISPFYKTRFPHLLILLFGRSTLYALFTAVAVLYSKKAAISIPGFNKRSLAFIAMAVLPLIWYLALQSHTMNHYFFTYRHTFVYMLGILLAMHEMFWPLGKKQE